MAAIAAAGMKEEDGTRCPLCSGTRTALLHAHGEYRIIGCSGCGGGFAVPGASAGAGGEIYDPGYVERYTNSVMGSRELARWRFRTFTRLLAAAGASPAATAPRRVLDIGCATGALLTEFREAGWEVEGTDVSPEFARLARARGVPVTVGDVSCMELMPERYDLITMSHVVEHLADPVAVLGRCAGWLRNDGALALETPNFRGIGALVRGARWSHFIPPEHLAYFGPGALRRVAARAGLVRVRTATTTPPFLEGVAGLPAPARRAASLAYRLAALAGLGTTLLGVAFKAGRAP